MREGVRLPNHHHDHFHHTQTHNHHNHHNHRSKELDEEMFDFYSRKLQGQKAQKSPEKRSVALVNAWLGELLGKVRSTAVFRTPP